MHTLSTRVLSALAFDRGEEYDPAQAICPSMLENLELIEHATAVIGEQGACERARRRARERRQRHAIPAWFSAEDLIAAPWETTGERFV